MASPTLEFRWAVYSGSGYDGPCVGAQQDTATVVVQGWGLQQKWIIPGGEEWRWLPVDYS